MQIDKCVLSVCVPTYRREDMLERLLATIPTNNVEVVISDNGGFLSDGFKLKHSEIRCVTTQNILPMFANWNNAIKASRMPYVVIPSDDDLFINEAFDTIHSYIEKYPDVDLFIFGHHVIDADDKILGAWCPKTQGMFIPPFGFKNFFYGVDARMPSIIFRKDLLNRLDNFDETFTLTAADSDLIQRALLFGKAMFIPSFISCYRVWPGGTTAKKQASGEWLDQIKYWTNKVSLLAEEQFQKQGYSFHTQRFCEEIFARNLISAMKNILSQGKSVEARAFIKTYGIPSHATFRTKFKLCKLAIRAFLF